MLTPRGIFDYFEKGRAAGRVLIEHELLTQRSFDTLIRNLQFDKRGCNQRADAPRGGSEDDCDHEEPTAPGERRERGRQGWRRERVAKPYQLWRENGQLKRAV